ncbi:hypothetical protein ACFW04_014141 [Cataglyphis niger]
MVVEPSSSLGGSGTYRLHAYTFLSTQQLNMCINLICITATEEKFDLVYAKKTVDNKNGVEITCLAEGLYPQPTLDISIEDISEKQIENPIVKLRDDGLYNISSRVVALDEDLLEATVVKCLLSIPKAAYNVSRKTVYYTESFKTTSAKLTFSPHDNGLCVLYESSVTIRKINKMPNRI